MTALVFVVHQHLFKKQVVTPMSTANETGITFPTVQSALQRLEKAGIAKEVTGKKRNKIFIYEKSLEILNRDWVRHEQKKQMILFLRGSELTEW